MRQHTWAVMTVAPIQVVADDQGKPTVFDVVPHQPGESMYGCIVCNESLESHFNTECKGRNNNG